jgi:hypothetical protein
MLKLLSLLPITGILTISAVSNTWALEDNRLNGQLMKLDPETRLEQTCDTEVMYRINRQHKEYTVDKVIAYSFDDSVISHETVEALGAVFRSRGHWYHLEYLCQTGPRHLDAHKLTYEIGAEVPRKQWAEHYLYD